MNTNHDQHVYHKWHVFVIFYVLHRASYGYIWCGYIPSAVWRLSNKVSSPFRCMNVALTRETPCIFEFHLGVVVRQVGGCQASGYVWLSVHWGHLNIPLYFCTCPIYLYVPTCQYVPHTWRRHLERPSVCLYVRHFCVCQYIPCSQQLYYCRPIIPIDQHYACLALVPMYSGLGFNAMLLSVWTGGLQMCA